MEKVLLIVEDDEDIEFALADLVADYGYRTITARDGVEALAVLRRGPLPFVIVTDLGLPRMDGYELIEALAADAVLCRIPIVVVTAAYDPDRRAIQGIRVLAKPIDSDVLLETIRGYDRAA
jgi:CheY-like chemotaxis protein